MGLIGKDYIRFSVSGTTHNFRSRIKLFRHRFFRREQSPFIEFSISESSLRARALHRRKVFSLLMAFYSVFIPTFLYFGLTEVSSSATYATEAASASESLRIPALDLSTPVTIIKKQGSDLASPDQIAGVYHSAKNKSFIIGHSSTVFENLKNITENDEIIYNNYAYEITNIETLTKSAISMSSLLKAEDVPTIVLMTCSGDSLGGHDYSHRLIITATQKSVSKSAVKDPAYVSSETTNANSRAASAYSESAYTKNQSAYANSENAIANYDSAIAKIQNPNASAETP